jgi:FtsP/CotA-like multicopper oxidase with cupredoxin domain
LDDFRELRARHGGPGPLLRVRRGEEVRVRLINDLPVDTTLHWHGVRLPNAMDGVPGLTQPPVAPGGSFDYRFTPPDAGTFWYRPAFRSAGPDRGLYGLLIVDEAQPVDTDRDLALVLDDTPQLTVNGLPALDIAVIANERVRLRLLNAADARFMTLRIDRHAATVMAIDGQPAEPFVARDSRVTLAPGNRLDLFVDMTLEPGSTSSIFVALDAAEVPLARLIYDARAPDRAAPRSETPPLPANALPTRMDFRGALRADIALDATADTTMPAKPLFSVRRGRTVVLALANRANAPHVLHTHGHCVRLLDRLDDGWKPFWLDTVPVLPQQTTRVAFVADNPGKWLLHARMIGGEANALRWFEVV